MLDTRLRGSDGVRPTCIVLTKLPGLLPVKTRLWTHLGRVRSERLYTAMLCETVNRLRRVSRPIVAYSPPDADPRAVLPQLSDCEFLPTPGRNGAECLEHAVADSDMGRPILVFGGDAPDLPARQIDALAEVLRHADAAIVPAGDGGFSALGLARPLKGLAHAFEFGAPDAAVALRHFVERQGGTCAVLSAWPDVDTPADLEAWMRRRRAARQSPIELTI